MNNQFNRTDQPAESTIAGFIRLSRRPVHTFGNLVSQAFCIRHDTSLGASRLEFWFGLIAIAVTGAIPLTIVISTSHMCFARLGFIDTIASMAISVVVMAAFAVTIYLSICLIALITRRLRDAGAASSITALRAIIVVYFIDLLLITPCPLLSQVVAIANTCALVAPLTIAAFKPSRSDNGPRYMVFNWDC